MGIYVYERRALAHLPAEGACQFPDLVQRLLDAGERVVPYRSDADWYDIGTIAEHERAVEDLEAGPRSSPLNGRRPGARARGAHPLKPEDVTDFQAEYRIVPPESRTRSFTGHASDAAQARRG